MRTVINTQDIIKDLAVSYMERNDFKAVESMLSSGQIDMDTLITKAYGIGHNKLTAIASVFRNRMSSQQLELASSFLMNPTLVENFQKQIQVAQSVEALLTQFKEGIIAELGVDYNADFSNTAKTLKSAIEKIAITIPNEMMPAFQAQFLYFFERNVTIPIKAWFQGRDASEVAAESILKRIADSVSKSVVADLKQRTAQEVVRESAEPDVFALNLASAYINNNDFVAIKTMISLGQIDMDGVLDEARKLGQDKLMAVASTFYQDLSRDQLKAVFSHLADNLISIKQFKQSVRSHIELDSLLTDFKNAVINDLAIDYEANLGNTTKLLKNSIALMHLEKEDVEVLKGTFLYSFETKVLIPIKAWIQGRGEDEIAAEKIASRIANKVVPEIIAQLDENARNAASTSQEPEQYLREEQQRDEDLFVELGGGDDLADRDDLAEFMNKHLGTNIQIGKQEQKQENTSSRGSKLAEILRRKTPETNDKKDKKLEKLMGKLGLSDSDMGGRGY